MKNRHPVSFVLPDNVLALGDSSPCPHPLLPLQPTCVDNVRLSPAGGYIRRIQSGLYTPRCLVIPTTRPFESQVSHRTACSEQCAGLPARLASPRLATRGNNTTRARIVKKRHGHVRASQEVRSARRLHTPLALAQLGDTIRGGGTSSKARSTRRWTA